MAGNKKTVKDTGNSSVQDSTPKTKVNVADAAMTLLLQGIASKSAPETLQDKLETTRQSVLKSIGDSNVVDRYGNSLTATGNEDKVKKFTNYGFSNDTLNYALWTALYNDSWVFRRAIDKPAQDTVKLGILLNMKDISKKSIIEIWLNKLKSKRVDLFKWGYLYGGSVAIMMFNTFDDADYAEPIKDKLDKVRKASVMRMYVTDRWYGVSTNLNDTVKNMDSIDYGKPRMYTITFPNGSNLKVHHDYILRYEHRNAPQLIKSGQLMGWGYAEGAHILNELARDDELKSAITSLINKCLIEVIKMDGMRGLFQGADEESKNQLMQRLEMVNWGRSFNSLTFLDSNDEYQMNGFGGLGGLSDLMEKNMWLISAALEMQGVLYGDLTQGFSHDSEALERYDDVIQGRADELARPCDEKLISTLYLWQGIDESVDFEYGSLLTDQKNIKKNEALDKHINRLGSLLNDGVISLTQYNKSLAHFLESGEVNLFITEETIAEAEKKAKEEAEGLDLQ